MELFCNRPDRRFIVDYVEEVSAVPADVRETPANGETPSETRPYYARLISNARVTGREHWQDVRIVKLDITAANIKYENFQLML